MTFYDPEDSPFLPLDQVGAAAPMPDFDFDFSTPSMARQTVVHAEVIAKPATQGGTPPDGAVQLAWKDKNGISHRIDIVKWWRLDRGNLSAGDLVRVDVQARQERHLSSPPHHLTAALMLTGAPEDEAEVMIGEFHRPGCWAYGIVFHGATLISTSVPT